MGLAPEAREEKLFQTAISHTHTHTHKAFFKNTLKKLNKVMIKAENNTIILLATETHSKNHLF